MTILSRITKWASVRGIFNNPYKRKEQANHILLELTELMLAATPEEEVDAYCDIVVFATNAIRLKGYDPDKAMQQTMIEIESRTGSFDTKTGKWEKFKTKSAMAKWKRADYSKAKL